MVRTRQALFVLIPIVLSALISCSEGGVTDPGENENNENTDNENTGSEVEVTEGVSREFSVDAVPVERGMEVRRIFQKGYQPTEAVIAFTDYPEFDATRPIDEGTNLAILSVHNDSLSDDEKEAFSHGVAATITIEDGSGTELAVYDDDALVLDDSNLPLSIGTALPRVARPLVLKEGMPYLLQFQENGEFLKSHFSDAYVDSAYAAEDAQLQFYFEPVAGEENVYHVLHLGYSEGPYWNVYSVPSVCIPEAPSCPDRYSLYLAGGNQPQPVDGPAEFAIEQDEDGWAKIRHVATGLYVGGPDQAIGPSVAEVVHLDETGKRFRIISDDIRWSLLDRGTEYLQPIMPPAELEFAYSATLRNCSAATLEEQVGRAETRTTTNTAETSESLQLFSSETLGSTLTLGYKVTAKVGVALEGVGEAGEEVEYSAQLGLSGEWTTSETTTSTQTFTDSETTGVEVSRIRNLTVPPNTAVEVYDAVKTVRDVRVPFTQTIRIAGSRRSDGTPLTGPELVTEMLFNFVGGLITEVGSDYVDITLRGTSSIDQLMEATTDVNDLPGACG